MNKMSQHCDSAKGKYASQLVKTNEFQSKYYKSYLPKVLEGLQLLEQQRINTLRHAIIKCVAKEKELIPIIHKCLEAVDKNMQSVDAVEDTEIAIERFKSGDVPPGDFKLEDMADPQAMLNQDALEKPSNLNLYPKKRELERSIEEAEKQLQKKQKELKSLQQMVATYKSNPKYGNSKHFAGEIENLVRS